MILRSPGWKVFIFFLFHILTSSYFNMQLNHSSEKWMEIKALHRTDEKITICKYANMQIWNYSINRMPSQKIDFVIILCRLLSTFWLSLRFHANHNYKPNINQISTINHQKKLVFRIKCARTHAIIMVKLSKQQMPEQTFPL